MADWKPDPKFVEFLEKLDKEYGPVITWSGHYLVEEMRKGTPLGQEYYYRFWNKPEWQKEFEKWKKTGKL